MIEALLGLAFAVFFAGLAWVVKKFLDLNDGTGW